MATVNAITKLEFTLADGNSDQVAFTISDHINLLGVDNVLKLLERVRSITRLAFIPALALLKGLTVNSDCVRGLDDKGLCIFSKLYIDFASLRRDIRDVETGGLLYIDIQDLNIIVDIEQLNVIHKRLYPTNETSESTAEHRYANTGFFGDIEVSKTWNFDLQADATSKVFGRAPQKYHSKGYFDEFGPFCHWTRDQFGAVNHDKSFVDIGHTVNGGNTPQKVIVVDVSNSLYATASDNSFDTLEKYLEGFFHETAIRAGIDQLDAVIHAGFDQFDAIKLVESFLDIGHTLEGRNTCHGVFEVIELVKSIVGIGHTLKGGDTPSEIANDLHKWHPAEALPLGVTTGPCAVF